MLEKPKTKAKVISFPQQKGTSPPAKQENSALEELKAILSGQVEGGTSEIETPAAHALSDQLGVAPITMNFTFNGGSHQIAGRDVKSAKIAHKPKEPKVYKPNTITPKQKAVLLALRDEIVIKSKKCEHPKHPGSVMKGLNLFMCVDSYHDISIENFASAKRHLENFIEAYDKAAMLAELEQTFRSGLWDSIEAIRAIVPDEALEIESSYLVDEEERRSRSLHELYSLYQSMVAITF